MGSTRPRRGALWDRLRVLSLALSPLLGLGVSHERARVPGPWGRGAARHGSGDLARRGATRRGGEGAVRWRVNEGWGRASCNSRAGSALAVGLITLIGLSLCSGIETSCMFRGHKVNRLFPTVRYGSNGYLGCVLFCFFKKNSLPINVYILERRGI